MSPLIGGLTALGVLVAAAAFGLWWQRRDGRVITPASGDAVGEQSRVLRELGAGESPLTLVQFSSPYCATCPGTRRLCAEVAAGVPGVRHLEIDVTAYPEAVRVLRIMRTPTVLAVDGSGRVVARLSGPPRPAELSAMVTWAVAAV